MAGRAGWDCCVAGKERPLASAEPAAVWLWVEWRWLHCCLELCSPACTALAGCAGGISVCCQVTLLPAPCTASTLMGHCSLQEWFRPHTAQLKEHQCVFRGLKPASIFFQLVFIHLFFNLLLTWRPDPTALLRLGALGQGVSAGTGHCGWYLACTSVVLLSVAVVSPAHFVREWVAAGTGWGSRIEWGVSSSLLKALGVNVLPC